MKKIALFSMVALALLFNQCKKNETPVADEGIYITLNAGCVNDGEKTTWTPSSGEFKWKSGKTEYIYVGGSNHTGCIGVLSGTGNGQSSMSFTGTITGATSGETLYFFYLGNNRKETTAATAKTTLDFSDQNGNKDQLTNYHVAIGSAVYNGESSFSAELTMATAFARFNLDALYLDQDYSQVDFIVEDGGEINLLTSFPIEISGNDIYSGVSINYQQGTIAPTSSGPINITSLGSDDGYVALIPSTVSTTALNFNNTYYYGSMTFNNGIRAGRYYAGANGAALNIAPLTITMLGAFYVDFQEYMIEHGYEAGSQYIFNNAGEEIYTDIESILGPDFVVPEGLPSIGFTVYDASVMASNRIDCILDTAFEPGMPLAVLVGYEDGNNIEWQVIEAIGDEDGAVLVSFDETFLTRIDDGRPVSFYVMMPMY